MELPQLSNKPFHHPDCCASLSKDLIRFLIKVLQPATALTLSIGSGTGLLEGLLLCHQPTLNLRAVEVSKDIPKYLATDKIEIVSGIWELCPSALEASSWIFVYPREPCLVKRYIEFYGQGKVNLVVWIGPRADFPVIGDLLLNTIWEEQIVGTCGLSDYETMIVWRRLDAGSCTKSPIQASC